jgi:trimethylamine--corrinoid protein Co-methyltransferase
MLDYVLTFSLPKLVFDNEVCGQALHFVRDFQVLDDLPTDELVDELLQDDDLITSSHTLKYWPQEFYLTGPVTDRENYENWEKAGSKKLYERACDEVDQRLAAYAPIETDAEIDTAMRELVIAGLKEQKSLPELPPPPEPAAAGAKTGRRSRTARRRNR